MSYKSIISKDLAGLLAVSDPLVLDMRDHASYSTDHIPTAIRVDDNVLSRLIRQKDFDKTIIIYCYRGNSSQDLCEFIFKLGFHKVLNLPGGWEAWDTHQKTDLANSTSHLMAWLTAHGFRSFDLNSRISNGLTPLMVASKIGDKEIISLLLKNNAAVNLLNDDQNNALWFACVNGDISIVKLLIANGANINNRNVNGATCLVYSASSGKLEVVLTLVEAGAALYLETYDGYTALDLASTINTLRYLKPLYELHRDKIN